MSSRQYLKGLIEILDGILDNSISQREASERLGISDTHFNHALNKNFNYQIAKLPVFNTQEILKYLRQARSPYERLLRDILNIPNDMDKVLSIPEDLETILNNILDKDLTPREKQIISEYCGLDDERPKTYRELGKKYSMTYAGAHALYTRAIRRLRTKENIKALCPDHPEYIKSINELEDIQAYNQELKNKIRSIVNNCKELQTENEAVSKLYNEFVRLTRKWHDTDTPIEDLDLNHRAYTTLKRHRIDTIDQLTALTQSELLNIPNIGVSTVEHIIDRLKPYDLSIKP